MKLTAIITREGKAFVSLCPELDIASQGSTVSDARKHLEEAVQLFFETASEKELDVRLKDEVYISSLEVVNG